MDIVGLRMRLLCALFAALALAAPATVLAQSAGDDQYSDPFASATPKAKPKPHVAQTPAATATAPPLSATPPTSARTSSASPTATATATASPAPAATATPRSSKLSSKLPNTGSDPAIAAGLGFGFLLAGTGLRLSLRAHGRRTL